MSDFLYTFAFNNRFFVELTFLCLLYSCPLERKKHYLLRFISTVVMGTVIFGLLPYNDLIFFILGVVGAALVVWFLCNVHFQEGLYCAACAYATQHFAFSLYCIISIFMKWDISSMDPVFISPVYLAVKVVVYVLFYLLFARLLADGRQYYVSVRQSIASTMLILVVVLLLSRATQNADVEGGQGLLLVCRAYAMFNCVFFLGMQVKSVKQAQAQAQLAFERHITREQREQYELTRETIEIINRKSHDLKHHINALRTLVPENQWEEYLSDIEKSVDIYDSTFKTGNEVLDTALTEKSLYCEAHDITMTCVADGSKLEFINPIDIFTICGNALDNAIESVAKLQDTDKRYINVLIREKTGLLVMQFENYFEHELIFTNGIPDTTKDNQFDHGIGLKSIRFTIEKYSGYMTINTDDNVFALNITIPIPG